LNPELLLAFVPGFRRLAENTQSIELSEGDLRAPVSIAEVTLELEKAT